MTCEQFQNNLIAALVDECPQDAVSAAHVASCEACRAFLRRQEVVFGALANLRADLSARQAPHVFVPPVDVPAQRRVIWAWRTVATAALAASLALMLVRLDPDQSKVLPRERVAGPADSRSTTDGPWLLSAPSLLLAARDAEELAAWIEGFSTPFDDGGERGGRHRAVSLGSPMMIPGLIRDELLIEEDLIWSEDNDETRERDDPDLPGFDLGFDDFGAADGRG